MIVYDYSHVATSRRRQFPSLIPSAQLSSSPRTHFNTTVRWISHSSITTLLKTHIRTLQYSCARQGFFQKPPAQAPPLPIQIPRYPSALSLEPSSLNPSSSTTTILFLPNEPLDQLFSKTPRSTTWTPSPSAQYAAPCYPSATREYTHRRFTSSAVRRLSLLWNLNNNAIPLDHEQGTI